VVAAFSQLHFGIEPIVATGVVTTADALRLVFYAILFMGIQAELEGDLSALRRANVELRRLGDVDTANALLAERARLAREIHDGLAQDLYYAKLTQTRLAEDETLDERTRGTAREVLTALDSALAEARQAVMAMRAQPTGSDFEAVVRTYVDEYSDRTGLRAEFHGDGSLDRLAARAEAEALRIVQEALNNVRRHADATLVRVAAEQRNGVVRLTVRDNGRGFDPGAVPPDRYGLRGMQERAALVGGSIAVESRPAGGTLVAVELPVEDPGT
jgi:signal transduction histidine kinase